MGTRGLVAYYYNGRYYIYYNNKDSYPNALGRALAQKIPRKPEKYSQWLEQARAEFAQLEQHLERTYWSTIKRIGTAGNEDTKKALIDHKPEGFPVDLEEYPPTFLPPPQDLFIEWTYVVDLEAEELKVAGHEAYRALDMRNINDDSMRDGTFFRYRDPYDPAEDELYRDWPYGKPHPYDEKHTIPPNESFQHTLAQLSSRVEELASGPDLEIMLMGVPDVSGLAPALRSTAEIARYSYQSWIFSDAIRTSLYISFSRTHVDDKAFRELCFAVLAIALPHVGWIDRKFHKQVRAGKRRLPTDHEPTMAQRLNQRLSTCFGTDGREAWLCPAEPIFLLGGLMVFICPKIEHQQVLQQALSYLAKGARLKGISSFKAIMLNLEYIVFVECTSDKIMHTKAMPFWPACDDDDRQIDPQVPKNIFQHLIAFHEAAEINRLCHENSTQGLPQTEGLVSTELSLPPEIWSRILVMTSPEARNACLEVSRELRRCAQEYCYILGGRPKRTIDLTDAKVLRAVEDGLFE